MASLDSNAKYEQMRANTVKALKELIGAVQHEDDKDNKFEERFIAHLDRFSEITYGGDMEIIAKDRRDNGRSRPHEIVSRFSEENEAIAQHIAQRLDTLIEEAKNALIQSGSPILSTAKQEEFSKVGHSKTEKWRTLTMSVARYLDLGMWLERKIDEKLIEWVAENIGQAVNLTDKRDEQIKGEPKKYEPKKDGQKKH